MGLFERKPDVRTAHGRTATRPLSLVWAGLLAGCVNYGHVAHRPGEAAVTREPEFELHFVESDDRGWFWEPARARESLDAIEAAAARGDAIVVLFTHGWHHSAACCDGNVEGFKEVLRRLRRELSEPMYQAARSIANTASPHREIAIIGVYAGWRGGSLPGLLDYATFWGRKAAAQRVGAGDLQEYMTRLQQLYDRHNRGPRHSFLGLVSIGHSFGGQVMLDATAPFIEAELEAADPRPLFMRRGAGDQPAPLDANAPRLDHSLSGFGDLVVLINPAVEAAAYERMHQLSMRMRYDPMQTPLMLTISADNDGPRHALFTAGRVAGEIFMAAAAIDDDRERHLGRDALGVYQGQVTHRIEPAIEGVTLLQSQLTRTAEKTCDSESCTFDWYQWKHHGERGLGAQPLNTLTAARPEILTKVKSFDFSSSLVFANVRLEPRQGAIEYQPLIVASASPSVIDGHNGMFSEPLMEFLTRYIGFTEAKRYLQTAVRKGWLQTPP